MKTVRNAFEIYFALRFTSKKTFGSSHNIRNNSQFDCRKKNFYSNLVENKKTNFTKNNGSHINFELNPVLGLKF